MTKKRRWSLLVAAIVASLTFGGLVAMTTPAGAALATNWSKIWKNQLQPKADKRYYKKAQADKKFAPKMKVIRGTFSVSGSAGGAGETPHLGSISFGYQMKTEPTVHYVPLGAPTPAGCLGDAGNPGAKKGHLCVFESAVQNATSNGVYRPDGTAGSGTTGAIVAATSSGAGLIYMAGTWVLNPGDYRGGYVGTARTAPRTAGPGAFGG